MNKLTVLIQGLLFPQEADDTVLLWAKEILSALLIVAFFWMLSQVVSSVLEKWGRKLASFTSTDLDDRLMQRIIPHVSRLLIIFGFYLAAQSLPLPESVLKVLSGLLFVILVVVVFNLIFHVLDELLTWYVAGIQGGAESLLSRQMVPIVEKIVTLIMMAAALIIILKHFNYDVFSLVTALGIGSLAIGMAAKDTLAHMISGFTLMLDRPFQIGDRIKLANGTVGDVSDIGLRSTKILGLDGTLLIIPNSDLCNSTVVNMVRPSPVTQGRTTIGVGYGSDISSVKQHLIELAGQDPDILDEPAPLAQFTSFGDSALNLQLLFWVNDPVRVGAVVDRLNCSILQKFREEDIEIPFPVRKVVMEKETNRCPTE